MRVALLIALLLSISAAHAGRIPQVGIASGFPQAKLPNGGYLPTDVPFPAVTDLSTLRITLARGPCFGSCPIYKVEVRGDGSVLFNGEGFVAISGHHRATVPKSSIDDLLTAFRKARFFSLLNNYAAPITDGARHIISISFGPHTKTVEDYFGLQAGMPDAVAELEKMVDTTAGTNRWIKGDEESIAALKAEGWNFSNQDQEHQRMVMDAAISADSNLLNAILDAGAKAKGFFGCSAAFYSARHSNLNALEKLIRHGAPIHWEPPPGDSGYEHWPCDVLMGALDDANPEIVRAILAQHPNVNRADERGSTPLLYFASLAGSGSGNADQHIIECVELLLAAGANPYVRDARGQSILDDAIAQKSPAVPVLKHWMEAHPQSR